MGGDDGAEKEKEEEGKEGVEKANKLFVIVNRCDTVLKNSLNIVTKLNLRPHLCIIW